MTLPQIYLYAELRTTRSYRQTQTETQRQAYCTSPSLTPPTIRFSSQVWYESTYIGRGFIADIQLPYIPYPLYIRDQALRELGAHPRSYGRMHFIILQCLSCSAHPVVLIRQRSSRSAHLVALIPQRSSCSAHPVALTPQRSSYSAHPVQRSSHTAHPLALIPCSAHPVALIPQRSSYSAHPVALIPQRSSRCTRRYHTFNFYLKIFQNSSQQIKSFEFFAKNLLTKTFLPYSGTF